MAFTWIGLVILLIGALLLVRGSVTSMFAFVLATSLLGGSSAINLPALGGSSIPPTYFALGFLAARLLLPGSGAMALAAPSVRDNFALAIFCLYGALSAFVLPRVFAGAINVTPMRSSGLRYIFETFPLAPSSQNVTTAVYLLGTLVAAVLASMTARTPRSAPRILTLMTVITWAHVILGFVAVGLTMAGQQQIIELFRNGAYAQLEHQYQGFIRITGFFPEASTFAAYGFVLLVLMVECWLRDLRPKQTGLAALAIGLTLVMSTSGSAYVGLAGYAVVLVGRIALLPSLTSPRKIMQLFGVMAILGFCGLTVAVASPQILNQLVDMIQHMTVDKADSLSGQQRRFWAEQGIGAFKVSYGLGVGPGSFRSSSIITAIAGSMGVVGLISFLVLNLAALKPLRASTYGGADVHPYQALGAACAWAACVGLLPALVAAPSPDPGLFFGVLVGLAVTWRSLPHVVGVAAEQPRRSEEAEAMAGIFAPNSVR